MSNSQFDPYKKIAEAAIAGAKTAAGFKANNASTKRGTVSSVSAKGGIQNPQSSALDKNYSAQSQNALDKYNTAQSQLEESRVRAKKEAGFNNTKLMKYMPSILKRQGLSGLGVSQSAVIAANNNYQTALTDIENDFQKNSADLLQNYNDAKLAYDTQYNSQKAQLEQAELDKQEAAKEKAEQKTAAEQSSNFENAWAIISADTTSTDFSELLAAYQGKVSDADYNTLVQLAASQVARNQAAIEEKSEADLKEDSLAAKNDTLSLVEILIAGEKYKEGLDYLESMKDVIGEDTYNIWKGYLEAEMGKNDEAEDVGLDSPGINQTGEGYENMTQEQKDERIISGKDLISYNGQSYRITGAVGDDKRILESADFASQIKEKGYKNGIFDANIKNGTTLEIALDWEDVIGQYSPVEPIKVTITYYNHEWYVSEHMGATDPLGVYRSMWYGQNQANGNDSLLNNVFNSR